MCCYHEHNIKKTESQTLEERERERRNSLMKTKYLAVGPDVVTHNSLRNNVRYIQTISKVCSNMPTRIIKSFVPFFTKLSFFMTLKVINLKVFFLRC